MTPDEVRLRFILTFDAMLLSYRRQVDDQDPTAAVPLFSDIKAMTLGIIPSRYDRGVIFGLDVCRLNDMASYSSGGGPTDWSLPDGVFPWDWVVSPGTLNDGQKLVNVLGSDQTPYVHRILLPSTVRGANFYAIGAVIYDCTTGALSTRLLGGNDPPITVEKEDITLEEIRTAAFRDDPIDSNFKVQPTSGEILVCRFLADVDEATDDLTSFTLETSNDKRRYPLASGLPCEQYAGLAMMIQSAIWLVDQDNFDTTTIYPLMLEICDAGTWGTSFYDYWTTPGRSLPDNVKYYYNAIFAPPAIS